MSATHSKVTAQGQVSVPVDIRRKLGLGPGSMLEWRVEGEHVVVSRAGRYSSEEIHHALFPEKAPRQSTIAELREGIRKSVRKRHARS